MKNDTIKGSTLAGIATFLILVVCGISYSMHWVTGYYMYQFIFLSCLFLGSTNLLFILLKLEDWRMKRPKKARAKKRFSKRKAVDIEDETEGVKIDVEKKRSVKLHVAINVVCFVLYIYIFYFCCKSAISYAGMVVNTEVPIIANAVFFLVLFVVVLVLDRLCKYSKDESTFVDGITQNSRLFFKLISALTLLATVMVIVESLQLFDIQKYVTYICVAAFFYYVAFVTISFMVIAIRRDFIVAPYISVPLPFVKNQIGGQTKGFIDYLEENTGISMRSLWSVKYVKQIAPVIIFTSAVLLWLSTCVVQVESYQQAAVYRIGKLQDEILEPGIHLILPYPFDNVEVYDTGMVQKTTIGYKAEESSDNIWTQGHEGEEFKLLLGGGDELVSINLRLEYKIHDLKKYLSTATAPESMMQALAYELVTDQTIATDLSSLMAVDRAQFSESFQKEMAKKLEERNIGLEIVSVVLESIHPPVDIASVYQELISAEITAEKYILYAQAVASTTIAEAETLHDTAVGVANKENAQKVATAKASVAEFLASVEANKANPDAYTYQKYLAAVRKAYKNANLVIISEDVDESALYFGNISGGNSSSNSAQKDSETTTE